MNDNQKTTDPMIPPMESDSSLQSYRCPHCGKFLFKGNVQKLSMLCHHCYKMISADVKDLLDPETE